MFPNLRLIIGAMIATLALAMFMGSGLFSFRDPQAGVADVPDVRRPLVQRAIVANPDRQHLQMLAYARRSDELQRLLDLPTSPGHASPPAVTASYPFDVKPSSEDLDQAGASNAPPSAGSPPAAAPNPAAAAPAAPKPERTPEGAGAPLPTIPPEQSPESGSAPLPAAKAALAPGQAPDDVVASPPAAQPEPTPEPPAAALPAAEPDLVPHAVATQDDRPGPAPSLLGPGQDGVSVSRPAGEPSTAAALPPPSDEPPSADIVVESPIPAIPHAPLPRLDPRTSDGQDAATASANRWEARRAAHAKPRKVIRTVRILRGRQVAPPEPAPAPQPPQATPSESNDFSYRDPGPL